MMTNQRERILIVDDDRGFRIATLALLQDEGYSVVATTRAEEAISKVAGDYFDLVLSDMVMEGMNGIDFLRHVKGKLPDLTVIMVTGFASVQTAVEAMKFGAYDYLTKPCNNDELLIKVRRALDERKRSKELERLRDIVGTTSHFSNIIGTSDRMKQVFHLVTQVAETDVTVLVLGETGSGKELIAQAVHNYSVRRDMPFVVVHCSAIPETLLESELFGHERGSFTGASRQRIGKFEEAHGGTAFLDEIGDMPFDVQTKLLRVLQEKQLTRLGSNASINVDVRIVAATNRNLESMVAEGKFREDLYYRLNVFPITLPPLRERIEDVPLLAEHFLKRYASLGRQTIHGFAPSVIHDMMNYEWRGNIREMENLIKRAIIKSTGSTISAIELPGSTVTSPPGDIDQSPATTTVPFKTYLDGVVRDAEHKYIIRLLKECRGNLNQVSRLMDVDRKTVYRKIDEYGIDVNQFKS
jgi:DNA-binding NtrC family response regulator